MKVTVKRIAMAMAVFTIMMSWMEIAFAAGSNSLAVSSNVIGTCRFVSASSTLAFGALDPSSAANATASGSTTFWCTKGASYSISDDGGLYNSGGPRMRHATTVTEFIAYSLSLSPTTGTGSGPATPTTLTINGSILNADYVNAAAGNYADTVVLTITP